MNEFIYLFLSLALVGGCLLFLQRKAELEAERKVLKIIAWAFTIIGAIGIVAMLIMHFFISTP
ncbi:hypothetical protein CN918_31805 [Priestia megaterium]|nr:hypothetical protein CN918_31805 [Priestia megaterium]